MKRTISSIVIITMLAFVAMSCGKKKSSGGGGNPYGYNPLIGGNFAQNPTNEQALAAVQQWIQNGQEPEYIGKRGWIAFNTISGSWDADFGTYKPDFCYITADNINYSFGTAGRDAQDGQCLNPVAVVKSSNPRILNAINGENGALTLIQAYFESQDLVTLKYALTSSVNGYYAPQVVVTHKFQLSRHSVINPVYSQDLRTRKTDVFVNITPSLY